MKKDFTSRTEARRQNWLSEEIVCERQFLGSWWPAGQLRDQKLPTAHSDQTPPSIFTKMFRQASWSWSGPPYFDPLVESSSHSQNAGLLSTRSNLFEKAAMLTQYTAVLAFLVALFASVVKCQIGLRS